MKGCLEKLGTIGGYVGAIICIAAVIGRFYGHPTFLSFNATHVFIGGVGIIAFTRWAKLEAGSAKE